MRKMVVWLPSVHASKSACFWDFLAQIVLHFRWERLGFPDRFDLIARAAVAAPISGVLRRPRARPRHRRGDPAGHNWVDAEPRGSSRSSSARSSARYRSRPKRPTAVAILDRDVGWLRIQRDTRRRSLDGIDLPDRVTRRSSPQCVATATRLPKMCGTKPSIKQSRL
jgi:hypothetical protein